MTLDPRPLFEVRIEPSLHPIGSLLGLLKPSAADRRQKRRALPRVLMVDLGHGRAEPLVQRGLDGLQLGPLGLQRSCLREVQVDAQDDDVP